MRIAIINGSPKPKDSNSKYLLDELKNMIENNNDILEINLNNKEVLDINSDKYYKDIYNCDVLVFGYPLYVDALPSHLLNYMVLLEEYIKTRESKKIIVYAIANCGFFEGNQNIISLQIMKNWCEKCKIIWGQGIGHGAGEMMGSIKSVPIGHGPKKNLGEAIKTLSENIMKEQSDEDILISPNFPRIAFRIAANNFWISKAKANKLKRSDLHRMEK